MNLLKKIFWIVYYFFLNTKNYIIFCIIIFLFKLNIYARFFDNYYHLLIFRLNRKNRIKLSKSLSKFFLVKKSKDMFNTYFLHPFFLNRGDIYTSFKLQNSFTEYQKMLK